MENPVGTAPSAPFIGVSLPTTSDGCIFKFYAISIMT
jgi:hypothetical protein